jgi:hypothetical protein
MAGNRWNMNVLNNTLLFIIKLLNEHNVKNWFIGYGTLLGMVRNNSCIDGDDDIDIIIDGENYDMIKEILIAKGLLIEYGYGIEDSRKILKTKDTDEYCSVDFYMAKLDDEGNYNDEWEQVIWSKCHDASNNLIQHIWNNNKLYVPFNYQEKLINRYGVNWMTPMNTKGPTPRKKVL